MNTQASALPTPRRIPTTPSVARTPSVLGGATAARLFTTVTPAPRVGGVLPDDGPGEPWTDGSNIHPQLMPISLRQRRPLK